MQDLHVQETKKLFPVRELWLVLGLLRHNNSFENKQHERRQAEKKTTTSFFFRDISCMFSRSRKSGKSIAPKKDGRDFKHIIGQEIYGRFRLV